MVTGMDYRILGPLELWAAGARIPVTGARTERILATLVLHANRMVPVTALVEAVWEGAPPATATRQARNCVSALRRGLVAAGVDGGVVSADGAGYRLRVCPGELDAERFDDLVACARAADDVALAAALLRQALELWRGPAMDGVDSGPVAASAARWNERRIAVWEEYIEHELALGQHHAVLAELVPLVDRHPLRERVVAQLMTALYRAGRASEALDLYRRTRSRLAEELGLDPGAELDRLHTLILRRDPSLDLVPGQPISSAVGQRVRGGQPPVYADSASAIPAAPSRNPGRSGPRV